ncbi:MAG: hypothetical protein HY769_08065 [Candidatus Stahlbacteria bacterium]|nr:hypothetical protein [Candidatus Stahlbacteria bacterium]
MNNLQICKYFICSIIFTLGCVSKTIISPALEPPSPDEVHQSIGRLAGQSFEFGIEFHKPGVKGKFKGINIDGKTKVEGVWKFVEAKQKSRLSRFSGGFGGDDSEEKFSGIGILDKEYKLENKEWKISQRTLNTDPINTLELVCSMKGYKFKCIESGSFVYEFRANILFIDPRLFNDTTYGTIWVDTKTCLPQKVGKKKKNIKWEFEVQSIVGNPVKNPAAGGAAGGTESRGGEYKIINPLMTMHKIELTISDTLIQSVAEILKQRFELYGAEEVKYKLSENILTIECLAESLDNGVIQSLIQQGFLELYRATYSHSSNEKGVYFVNGNPTEPVLLGEKIECKLVDATFQPEVLGVHSNSMIELNFEEELPKEQLIAVMVDDEVIGIIPKVWGKSFKIAGNRLVWIKIKLPLPGNVITEHR